MVTVATDAKRSRGALGLKKRLGPTSGSDLALRAVVAAWNAAERREECR